MTITMASLANAWKVDSRDCPANGRIEDVIRFCLNYAILAPSSHNTQPWWFSLDDDSLTVGLDVSRGLAVSDPLDRQGVMSAGAVAMNLRVALAHFGLAVRIQQFPEPLDPEACLRLAVSRDRDEDHELTPLFSALTLRRTSRAAFEADEVEPRLLDLVSGDAAAEGVDLRLFVAEPDRAWIAGLVSDADRVQMADRAFRRELATWLRRPGSLQHDGIHGHIYGSALDEVALSDPLVVRSFDTGAQRGARDRELVTGSPVMVVISTDGDDRDDWLRAGQALERILLRATANGLSTGFLGQAVEVPAVRAELADGLRGQSTPQAIVRLGRGPLIEPQPRRDLASFLCAGR